MLGGFLCIFLPHEFGYKNDCSYCCLRKFSGLSFSTLSFTKEPISPCLIEDSILILSGYVKASISIFSEVSLYLVVGISLNQKQSSITTAIELRSSSPYNSDHGCLLLVRYGVSRSRLLEGYLEEEKCPLAREDYQHLCKGITSHPCFIQQLLITSGSFYNIVIVVHSRFMFVTLLTAKMDSH